MDTEDRSGGLRPDGPRHSAGQIPGAITQGLAVKRERWREVEAVATPGAVFATNGSSLAAIDQIDAAV